MLVCLANGEHEVSCKNNYLHNTSIVKYRQIIHPILLLKYYSLIRLISFNHVYFLLKGGAVSKLTIIAKMKF
jgi:hypothetical protein